MACQSIQSSLHQRPPGSQAENLTGDDVTAYCTTVRLKEKALGTEALGTEAPMMPLGCQRAPETCTAAARSR